MLKVGICFLAVQAVTFLLLYPLLIAGKREDEQMQLLFEEKRAAEGRKELEDKMESQRDVLRMIEKEISKGSVPVRFAGMGFTEDTYHLVESKAKMNQLLDYFFRIGEFAALAVIGDNTVLSIVMPASKPDTTFLKLPFFFMLRSSLSYICIKTDSP